MELVDSVGLLDGLELTAVGVPGADVAEDVDVGAAAEDVVGLLAGEVTDDVDVAAGVVGLPVGFGERRWGANVTSTQYWLECHVLVGNRLVDPYRNTPEFDEGTLR